MRITSWTSLNRVCGSFNFSIIFTIFVNFFNLHSWLFRYFIRQFDKFYWIIFQIKLLAASSLMITIIKIFTSLLNFIINFKIDLNPNPVTNIIHAHFPIFNFNLFPIFITHGFTFTHPLILLPWYNCLFLHFF